MAIPKTKQYYSEFAFDQWKLWDDQWELIEGVPYAMAPPMPSGKHQFTNANIIAELRNKLRGCKNCKAYMPVDWKISDVTIVEPDAMVVCNVEFDQYLETAPMVVFEVLSPSTEKKDRELKFRIYEEQRVKFYVIVDPKNETAEVYQWSESGFVQKKKTRDGDFEFDLDECKMNFEFRNIWN